MFDDDTFNSQPHTRLTCWTSYESALYFFQFTASYEADRHLADPSVGDSDFQFTASYEADLNLAADPYDTVNLSIHSLIRG